MRTRFGLRCPFYGRESGRCATAYLLVPGVGGPVSGLRCAHGLQDVSPLTIVNCD